MDSTITILLLWKLWSGSILSLGKVDCTITILLQRREERGGYVGQLAAQRAAVSSSLEPLPCASAVIIVVAGVEDGSAATVAG